MKALIINQHENNHGDEAAYQGLLETLGDHDVEIVGVVLNSIEGSYPSSFIRGITPNVTQGRLKTVWEKALSLLGCYSRHMTRLLTIFSKTSRRLRDLIISADIIIVGPGGENIGAYRDWLYLSNINMAIMLGKPVIFPGNSFGPSGSELFDKKALQLLRLCHVVAREEISYGYLKANGIKVSLGCDCALFLVHKFQERQALGYIGNKEYAIFVPNQLWKWHPLYKERMNDLKSLYESIIRSLLNNFNHVKLLPQTSPYPNGIEDFGCYLSLSDKVSVVEAKSPQDQLEVISKASCLIGMRYHSIVFSAIANVPSYAFGYERKMRGFNQRFYLGRGYTDISGRDYEKSFEIDDMLGQTVLPNRQMFLEAINRSRELLISIISDA